MEIFLVLLVTVIFPPILLFGFFVVNPREEMVILRFGKHVTTLKTQGIRWIHPSAGARAPAGTHASCALRVALGGSNEYFLVSLRAEGA